MLVDVRGLVVILLLPSTSGLHANFPARSRSPRAPAPLAIVDLSGAGVHSGTAAFAAAFAASCVATVALHPVDTLKTRQQHAATGTDASAGVWRGVSANVLKEAPDAAVFLAVSEQLSQSLVFHSPWFASHLTMTLLLAGAIGDAIGSIFRLPAEVLCKRLQTDSALCWHEALSDITPASWMAAWEAILVRDVPMGGLQIAAYRQAHVSLAPFAAAIGASLESVPDSLSDCTAGLLAGACAAALTTPLDVLVTRAATARPHADDNAPPLGPMQLGAELVRAEGVGSLTRGLGARTVYYAWVCACFFGLYEYFRRILEAHGL